MLCFSGVELYSRWVPLKKKLSGYLAPDINTSDCFWAPLFQTNRISRRINKLSENLTAFLSIFTLNIKPFLWKYHILPTLFWAALILLRSKQRKYWPWNVYSPEPNGVFCNCFASFQLAKTFVLKLKCSAFIRNTSFTESWKGRLKNWVFVLSVRILVPSGYRVTYCNGKNVQKLWKNRCFVIKLTILTL